MKKSTIASLSAAAMLSLPIAAISDDNDNVGKHNEIFDSTQVVESDQCGLSSKYALSFGGTTKAGESFKAIGTLTVTDDVANFYGIVIDLKTGIMRKATGTGYIELKNDCLVSGDLTILDHVVEYVAVSGADALIGNIQLQNSVGLAPITGSLKSLSN